MSKKRELTYAERATDYAKRVVGGKVPACRPVRLACQRHLDDLKASKTKEYPYEYSATVANRKCAFLELLPHVKGRWAREHQRIKLEDWQCFVVCVSFGWVSRSTGLRRFRRAYIEVPRKNAKSTLTAALGLEMLANDGEHGAEVYCGASSEKQAWEVFGPARLMAQNTPDFVGEFGVDVNAKNLHILATASKFEPVIGNPGDGASPTFSITDEYHEHATSEQYDTMVTGMGSREQPMAWVITTAGSNTAGPCYRLRSEVLACLEGTIPNEELFGIVYTIDAEDDWTSEAAIRKANPNCDVSVFLPYLLSQQRDAINHPSKQSTFKTKHLNVWVTAASPFFNAEKWRRLGDAPAISEFKGQPCWIGLDLASKLDIVAAVRLFRRVVDEVEHWYVYPRLYIPETQAQDPTNATYVDWVDRGELVATPGNVTDFDAVEDDLLADATDYRIVQVGYDPWNATQIATHLAGNGVEVVEIAQTAKHLSDPMKWVQALIEDGRIHHDGNRCMSWMIGNVTAQIDRNDNVYPRKESPEKKIDGPVALIIAKGRALSGEEAKPSIYETRGILVA